MFLAIIYTVLWILMALACFAPETTYPYAVRGRWFIAIILFGIIGYCLFQTQMGGHYSR